MFDRHEQRTTELHQNNRDGGDNVGRDKIIHNHLYGSVDYQQLVDDIRDREDLLAGIAPDKIDLRLKQSAKLEELNRRLEDFKANVFRLHELFTRIPINTERLRKAKAYFDKGEFREADAVLKAEDIQQDVERLHKEKGAVKERLVAIEQDLEGRANEYLLKARLSLLNPVKEGEDRFQRTEQWFEQALKTARTAEVLFEYVVFLYEHNAFGRGEPLCQEALKMCRREKNAESNTFFSSVATTLNNLAALHQRTHDYGLALKEYEEALKIFRILVEVEPKEFQSGLALILNNLGELHRVTNIFDLSAGAFEEALQIRRTLAKENLKEFDSDVVQTLNNLALLHADMQDYIPALKGYEEALEISRRLTKTDPDTFCPNVAMILNNIALLHADMEDYAPALKEYEEALKIRRTLAKIEPKAFLPDVAMTLNNIAILYYETEEYGPALGNYEETLQVFRSLAKAEPKAFIPNVAMTLNNLALLHSEVQDFDSALQEFEEALKLYGSLAARELKVFAQGLVETLLNLSLFYIQAVPDKAKSVDYAQEARDILIPLCQQAPHLQNYLDKAEQVLAANKAKPEE